MSERILDVGCGTGHLTAEIAEHGATVHGVDASAEMIDSAREQYPDRSVEQADALVPGGRFVAVRADPRQ